MSAPTKERERTNQQLPTNVNLPATFGETTVNRVFEFVPLGTSDPIKLSIAIIRLILRPRTKSGREAPDDQVMKFIMLCQARRLNPFESDAYLIGYESEDGDQWSLITSIYAFLKRAEVNPEYEGMESGVIVRTAAGDIEEHVGDFLLDDELLLGGWCKVHRSDRKYPNHKRVEFKRYGTGKSRWKADPGGMIVKVAECQALRDTFPTTLGGLFMAEEMEGTLTIEPTKVNILPTKGGSLKPKPEQAAPAEQPQIKDDGEIIEPVTTAPAPKPAEPSKPASGKAVRASTEQLDEIEVQATIKGVAIRTMIGQLNFTTGSGKTKPLIELTSDEAERALRHLGTLPDARQPGDESEVS